MRNDELPHAGGFPDDKISRHLRELIGDVSDDWRAYYFDSLRDGKILIRGARIQAVRPDGGYVWTRPMLEGRQRTITGVKYGELLG